MATLRGEPACRKSAFSAGSSSCRCCWASSSAAGSTQNFGFGTFWTAPLLILGAGARMLVGMEMDAKRMSLALFDACAEICRSAFGRRLSRGRRGSGVLYLSRPLVERPPARQRRQRGDLDVAVDRALRLLGRSADDGEPARRAAAARRGRSESSSGVSSFCAAVREAGP